MKGKRDASEADLLPASLVCLPGNGREGVGMVCVCKG